jgi:curved DNA-binding protein CbpA
VRGLVQEATEKFQSLQRVFQVLSDPQRRAVYDQTGSLADSEELAGKDFNTLYEYYRDLYKKVRSPRGPACNHRLMWAVTCAVGSCMCERGCDGGAGWW